jgi:enediyne biosynthesis protein E8
MDGRERSSAPDGSGMPRWVATRRTFLHRAGLLGLAAVVAEAVPLARSLPFAEAAPGHVDATLQAFADTILPGRRASRTDLGNAIDPRAIAGVEDRPGAVEADALALYRHPKVGFDTLAPAFLAELTTRSLPRGGDFLGLSFERRVAVCRDGLAFANPTRTVWEAAAAVPFTAFCAAALIPEQTAERACGYRVMGHPGVAPDGYSDFSYGRELARELTVDGSLP